MTAYIYCHKFFLAHENKKKKDRSFIPTEKCNAFLYKHAKFHGSSIRNKLVVRLSLHNIHFFASHMEH